MEFVFNHFNFFCLRVAQKPITYLQDSIDAFRSGSTELDTGTLLQHILNRPWLKEALYLASPGLYTSWLTTIEAGKKPSQAVEQALWRYVFRAYSRSTPFGLFAATAIGTISTVSELTFDSDSWKPDNRPDASVIIGIIHALESHPQIRSTLSYRINNSVYKAVQSFRYSETSFDGDDTKINLSSVKSSPQLERLLSHLSTTRFESYPQLLLLANSLQLTPEIIDALIDAQLLTSNLQLPVTGASMHNSLLKQLVSLSGLEPVRLWTSQLEQALQWLTPPLSIQRLISAQETLSQLSVETNQETTAPKSLIQTDLYFKPARLLLDQSTVLAVAHQFNEVLPAIQATANSPFQTFQSQFKERYGHQTVALLEALDPEIGIGYNTDDLAKYPLLAELAHVKKNSVLPSTLSRDLDDFRQTLFKRHLLSNSHEIAITESDIKQLREKRMPKPLPACWFVHGELYRIKGDNNQTPTSGSPANWTFLVNPSVAPNPTALLGRFCLGDSAISDALQNLCGWEQAQFPNDILAEFVHLPTQSTSTGNLIVRPVLRPYEIPYLNPAAVDPQHTLLLSDLYVTVTAEDQVILTHKPTGKRVRPRHSTAHNSLRGDEVYQFISHLQHAESNAHFWSWGHFEQMPFLPRLVYKNLVVTPAQWTLDRAAVSDWQTATIDELRGLYKLPRYVQVIDGDNKLLLDLEFVPAQQILLDMFSKRKVLLYEWLGDHFDHWVQNGSDRYESEFIIPLRTENSFTEPLRLPSVSATSRNYFPGQEWFYIKLYCQELASDLLLAKAIKPFWQYIHSKGWSTQLFFIRYTDPGYHLRVRFLCDPNKVDLVFQQLPAFLKPFLDSRLIERYQIDTYQRELERYYPELMPDTESIFAADSQLVLQFFHQAEQPEELDRYALSMGSIDQLYADFGLSMEVRAYLSATLQKTFWQEQGSDKEIKGKLNDIYRSWETSLVETMQMQAPLLEMRSQAIHHQVVSVQNFFNNQPNPKALWDWLTQLNHMSLTRIFTGQNRQHEMVTYHFLARYYASKVARKNKTQPIE